MTEYNNVCPCKDCITFPMCFSKVQRYVYISQVIYKLKLECSIFKKFCNNNFSDYDSAEKYLVKLRKISKVFTPKEDKEKWIV